MRFKWPWVSRYRLEDAQEERDVAREERDRYLQMVLESVAHKHRVVPEQVRVIPIVRDEPNEPSEATKSVDVEPQGFSTPFDRQLSRFDKAFGTGRIPAKFKAKG